MKKILGRFAKRQKQIEFLFEQRNYWKLSRKYIHIYLSYQIHHHYLLSYLTIVTFVINKVNKKCTSHSFDTITKADEYTYVKNRLYFTFSLPL